MREIRRDEPSPESVLADFIAREKKRKMPFQEEAKEKEISPDPKPRSVFVYTSAKRSEEEDTKTLEKKKEMDRIMNRLMSDIDIKTVTCRKIIEKLFFSDTRTEVCVCMELKKMIAIKKELKSYYATKIKCGIPINFMDAFKYYYNAYSRHTFIEEDSGARIVERTFALPVNEEFLKFATSIVMLQWKISCLSPFGMSNASDLDFINHTLAVLSHMKKGGRNQYVDGMSCVQIIPPSRYARKNWPPLNDIEYYGFKKAMITMGTRTLMKVWKSINDDKDCIFPAETLSKMYKEIKHV